MSKETKDQTETREETIAGTIRDISRKIKENNKGAKALLNLKKPSESIKNAINELKAENDKLISYAGKYVVEQLSKIE